MRSNSVLATGRFLLTAALILSVGRGCGEVQPANPSSGGEGVGGAGEGGKGGGVAAGGTGGTGGAAEAAGKDASVPSAADAAQVAMEPDAAPAASDASTSAPAVPENVKGLIAEMIGRLDETAIGRGFGDIESMSLPNRASGTENYRQVSEWVKAKIESSGTALAVRFQEGGGLRNVEITLKGTDPEAGTYILGGHLDSVRAGPGMDDDASGSIGAMFLALAMAPYRFKSEIRFLLFDAEEIGFRGSDMYAKLIKPTCPPDSCLKLYVNLDMIGNDPRNRRGVNVRTTDVQLRALHTQINTDHMLGMLLRFINTTACNASDDCSFLRNGFKILEDVESDFSPNYHNARDRNAGLNFTTLTKHLALVGGVVATLAGIEGPR